MADAKVRVPMLDGGFAGVRRRHDGPIELTLSTFTEEGDGTTKVGALSEVSADALCDALRGALDRG